jgi:gluconate 5-dehydrogenase
MTHDPQLRNVQQLFNLAGRSAIVTGGSRGLGLEIAEGLAEAGASVMLCARRKEWLMPAEESLRARGFQVASMLCDVCVPDQVDAVVQQTLAAFGTVDILVNNAGISWGDIPEQYPLEKWRRVLDVNLTGAFLFAQAAGREMLKRQFGRIINISSVSGLVSLVQGPHYVAYAASKAGLLGLTRELAGSWGKAGIRVNAIAPGFFHSRLADPVLPLVEPLIRETNALPRIGAAGELKAVVVFLAADASNYITGHTLAVDGGMTVT